MSIQIRKLLIHTDAGARKCLIVGSTDEGAQSLYVFRQEDDGHSRLGPLLVIGRATMFPEFVLLGPNTIATDDEPDPVDLGSDKRTLNVPPAALNQWFEIWPKITWHDKPYMLIGDRRFRDPETAKLIPRRKSPRRPAA